MVIVGPAFSLPFPLPFETEDAGSAEGSDVSFSFPFAEVALGPLVERDVF